MPIEQSPSKDRYVVKWPREGPPAASRLLEAQGSLERRVGTDVVVVRARAEASDAESGWRRMRSGVPGALWVAPVLLDPRGGAHLPTGDVAVRFDERPDDAALARFAAQHGLALKQRNPYVAQQATFEVPGLGEVFLPDLIRRLRAAPAVSAAWAETQSDYKRA